MAVGYLTDGTFFFIHPFSPGCRAQIRFDPFRAFLNTNRESSVGSKSASRDPMRNRPQSVRGSIFHTSSISSGSGIPRNDTASRGANGATTSCGATCRRSRANNFLPP